MSIKMKTGINSVELTLYYLGWITGNLYTLNLLYKEQKEILNVNKDSIPDLKNLQPGWKFLSELRDVSDFEWISWKYFVLESWCYMLFQFAVTEVIRRKAPSHLKIWHTISSTIFILFYKGFKQYMIILIQPLVYAALISCGGKETEIWIISIINLLGYNSLKYKFFFWQFLAELKDEEVFILLVSVAWIELRCISFCLDYIEKNSKNSDMHFDWESFIDMMSYVLYLPVLYTGPIILYEDYERSFHTEPEKLCNRLKTFALDIALFLLYSLAMDVALHYLLFYSFEDNIELVSMFSGLGLCGAGLWMGLQFHSKYVVAYGTTTALARLDNIDAPPTPRCIARIHVYSQMWRYFDVGLYQFLVKYIYRPSFKVISSHTKLPKVARKLIASSFTFLFIFIWHGTTKQIFVWTLLNYLGITLEAFSKIVGETEMYKWFKTNVLRTQGMETRFIAVLCAPLLILSAVSNFYLFAGTEIGDLFFKYLQTPTLRSSIVVFAAMYCCCQVSMALEDVPSRTDKKRLTVKLKKSEYSQIKSETLI